MIETNVAMPEKVEKVKKGKKEALPSKALIEALNFIKPIQKNKGAIEQQYAMAAYGWLAATNNGITIGCKIEENLNTFLHTNNFLKAMKECKEEFSITHINAQSLAVNCGDFKGVIECLPLDTFTIAPPNPGTLPVNEELKHAIQNALVFCPPKAPNDFILINPLSVVGNNGIGLIETKHLNEIPESFIISYEAAKLVSKVKHNLKAIGYNETSITFHFENDSFIQTELENEIYPEYNQLFTIGNCAINVKLPENFQKAVKAMTSLTQDENIFFKDGRLATSENEEHESLFKIEGIPEGYGFNAKELAKIAILLKDVYFDKTKLLFYNNDCRGILMALDNLENEEIPF